MKKTLGALAVLIVAALVVVSLLALRQPDSFRIERQTLVLAPPATVYAQIVDIERMRLWNPWERKDPSVRGTYGATRAGLGAHYAWQSDKVGAGSMTITETVPERRVAFRLDFLEPMASTNQAVYTLTPEGAGTRVSWAMTGPSGFVTRVMQVVLDFDGLLGRDFEAGLANLKIQAEAR